MTLFNQLQLDSRVDKKYLKEIEHEKVTIRGKFWNGNILVVKGNYNLFSRESIKALTL